MIPLIISSPNQSTIEDYLKETEQENWQVDDSIDLDEITGPAGNLEESPLDFS